ncbi:MAG: 1-phosphofructokinase [Clostridiales bacterium]
MKQNVLTVTLNPAIDKTIVIDKYKSGELNRANSVRMDPGGKGINVAKVLNEFGVEVFTTGFNAGVQGKNLIEYIDIKNIKSNFYDVDEGETRTNLKIVEKFSNVTTEINESGFTVPKNRVHAFIDEFSDQLNDISLVVLSGSLPPGVDDDIYYRLIKISKEKGIKTILDADGIAFKNGIKAKPYAIKPNIFELEKLSNRKIHTLYDIVNNTNNLIDSGIEFISVSMGAKGAVIITKENILNVKTFDIIPRSTVGAGDSMVAALVFSILNNFDLENTARWMACAGTITASKPGTKVCSVEEVIESIHKVSVESVDWSNL